MAQGLVLGGSMAGLLAARVLADHCRRVTVIDGDVLPARPDHRRGVPQSWHGHSLLVRGKEVIEELFPGIIRELAADGAVVEDIMTGLDSGLRLVGPAGPFAEAQLGRAFVGVSRPLLEWRVRRRLAALPNVRILHGVKVRELAGSADASRVTGAVLHPVDEPGAAAVVAADLVVDATGRRSRAPQWLTALGYDAPPETSIESGLGYASRWYRRPARPAAGWEALIVNSRPRSNPRAGLVLPVEDDRWTVTLAGFAGQYPPTDEQGFLGWARDLPEAGLYEAIRDAVPMSSIHAYRTPTNRLRHFDQLDRWPRGFLVTGDAVCAFNPIYGQGMTTSALDALDLRRALRGPRGDLERVFRRRLARTVAAPWQIATGEDARWKVPVHGQQRPGLTRLRSRYADAVLAAATTDPAVAGAYLKVMQMLATPSSLARPDLAVRVLRHRLRHAQQPIDVGG